jgi:hypothetical protein
MHAGCSGLLPRLLSTDCATTSIDDPRLTRSTLSPVASDGYVGMRAARGDTVYKCVHVLCGPSLLLPSAAQVPFFAMGFYMGICMARAVFVSYGMNTSFKFASMLASYRVSNIISHPYSKVLLDVTYLRNGLIPGLIFSHPHPISIPFLPQLPLYVEYPNPPTRTGTWKCSPFCSARITNLTSTSGKNVLTPLAPKYSSVLKVRLYLWSPSCLNSVSRSTGVVNGAVEEGCHDVTRPSALVVAEKVGGEDEAVWLCLITRLVLRFKYCENRIKRAV